MSNETIKSINWDLLKVFIVFKNMESSYSVSKSIYEGVNYKLVLYLKRYLKIKMINYSTKTNTSKHLNLKAKFL